MRLQPGIESILFSMPICSMMLERNKMSKTRLNSQLEAMATFCLRGSAAFGTAQLPSGSLYRGSVGVGSYLAYVYLKAKDELPNLYLWEA